MLSRCIAGSAFTVTVLLHARLLQLQLLPYTVEAKARRPALKLKGLIRETCMCVHGGGCRPSGSSQAFNAKQTTQRSSNISVPVMYVHSCNAM